MYTLLIFVYRKIKIFEYSYKIAVLVMTEIVLAHDQKHVPGHYFSVRPNALPKRTPGIRSICEALVENKLKLAWATTRRLGVQFPVGTVLKLSFMIFARGCRL